MCLIIDIPQILLGALHYGIDIIQLLLVHTDTTFPKSKQSDFLKYLPLAVLDLILLSLNICKNEYLPKRINVTRVLAQS